MNRIDDYLYVERVKAGDIQAFTYLVEKYRQILLTVVMKIESNRENAEDIVQEIFIKVFRSLEKFRGEAAFSTWIYRIAYNTTLSELKKRKLYFTPINEDLSPDNEMITDDSDGMNTEIKIGYLNEALKKISPDEIFLITLHYIDDRSIDEMAKITNQSVSNVKIKLYRIRKKLAVEINKLMQNENS